MDFRDSRPVDGPWKVAIGYDERWGHTYYHMVTHTHATVAAGQECWPDGVEPSFDPDGYFVPDDNMHIDPKRVVMAELLAQVPALIAAASKMFEVEDASREETYRLAEAGELRQDDAERLALASLGHRDRLRKVLKAIEATGFRPNVMGGR